VGRLFQVEYAMEAVKQGSAAVGVRGPDHSGPRRRSSARRRRCRRTSARSSTIDEHVGIAIAGLNADGRALSRFMRSESLNHRFVTSPPPHRPPRRDGRDKSQVCTQRSWKRPYGVGLLVAGYDATGPHLFQTCPSGNFWEFHAMAIGSRSQAAKTYLERKFDQFGACGLDELIQHALYAVKESLQEGELTGQNCSLAIVGKGTPFKILEDEEVQAHIASMEALDSRARGAGGGGGRGRGRGDCGRPGGGRGARRWLRGRRVARAAEDEGAGAGDEPAPDARMRGGGGGLPAWCGPHRAPVSVPRSHSLPVMPGLAPGLLWKPVWCCFTDRWSGSDGTWEGDAVKAPGVILLKAQG